MADEISKELSEFAKMLDMGEDALENFLGRARLTIAGLRDLAKSLDNDRMAIKSHIQAMIDGTSMIGQFNKAVDAAREAQKKLSTAIKDGTGDVKKLREEYESQRNTAKNLLSDLNKESTARAKLNEEIKRMAMTDKERAEAAKTASQKYKDAQESVNKTLKDGIGSVLKIGVAFGGQALTLNNAKNAVIQYNDSMFKLSRAQQITRGSVADLDKVLKNIKDTTILSKQEFIDLAHSVTSSFLGVKPSIEAVAKLTKSMQDQFGPNLETIKQKTQGLIGIQNKFPALYDQIIKAQSTLAKGDEYSASVMKASIQSRMMALNYSSEEQDMVLQYLTKVTPMQKAGMELNEQAAKAEREHKDALLAAGKTMENVFIGAAKLVEKFNKGLGSIPFLVGGAMVAMTGLGMAIGGLKFRTDLLAGLQALKAAGGAGGGIPAGVPSVAGGVGGYASSGGLGGKLFGGGKLGKVAGGAIGGVAGTMADVGIGALIGGDDDTSSNVSYGAKKFAQTVTGGATAFATGGVAGLGVYGVGKLGEAFMANRKANKGTDVENKLATDSYATRAQNNVSAEETLRSRAKLEGKEKELAMGKELANIKKSIELRMAGRKESEKQKVLALELNILGKKNPDILVQTNKELDVINKNFESELKVVNDVSQSLNKQIGIQKELGNLSENILRSSADNAQQMGEITDKNLDKVRTSLKTYFGANGNTKLMFGTDDENLGKISANIQEKIGKRMDVENKPSKTKEDLVEIERLNSEIAEDQAKQKVYNDAITAQLEAQKNIVITMLAKSTSKQETMISFSRAWQEDTESLKSLMESTGFGVIASLEQTQRLVEQNNIIVGQYDEALENLKSESVEIAKQYGIAKDLDSLRKSMTAVDAQSRIDKLKVGKDKTEQEKLQSLLNIEEKTHKLQKEKNGVMQKTMEMTKTMREGYLEAIKEMAVGAGEFSKIIATQDMGYSEIVKTMRSANKGEEGVDLMGNTYAKGGGSSRRANPEAFTSRQSAIAINTVNGIKVNKEAEKKQFVEIDNRKREANAGAAIYTQAHLDAAKESGAGGAPGSKTGFVGPTVANPLVAISGGASIPQVNSPSPSALLGNADELTKASTRLVPVFNALAEAAGKATNNINGKAGVVPVHKATGGSVGYFSNGMEPKGTDTVPAMLTPGEWVINKKSSEKMKAMYGNDVMDKINKNGTLYAAEGKEASDEKIRIGKEMVKNLLSTSNGIKILTSVNDVVKDAFIGNTSITEHNRKIREARIKVKEAEKNKSRNTPSQNAERLRKIQEETNRLKKVQEQYVIDKNIKEKRAIEHKLYMEKQNSSMSNIMPTESDKQINIMDRLLHPDTIKGKSTLEDTSAWTKNRFLQIGLPKNKLSKIINTTDPTKPDYVSGSIDLVKPKPVKQAKRKPKGYIDWSVDPVKPVKQASKTVSDIPYYISGNAPVANLGVPKNIDVRDQDKIGVFGSAKEQFEKDRNTNKSALDISNSKEAERRNKQRKSTQDRLDKLAVENLHRDAARLMKPEPVFRDVHGNVYDPMSRGKTQTGPREPIQASNDPSKANIERIQASNDPSKSNIDRTQHLARLPAPTAHIGAYVASGGLAELRANEIVAPKENFDSGRSGDKSGAVKVEISFKGGAEEYLSAARQLVTGVANS